MYRFCKNIILFVLTVVGVNESISAAEENAQFISINDHLDISIREANQVCEDKNGFIWIASKMGIVRYTRSDVRLYHLNYDNQNFTSVNFEYANGVLYAYTDRGHIYKYNQILDKFESQINIAQILRNNYLYNFRILCDKRGDIWIASSTGLFRFSESNGLEHLLQDGEINCIEWMDDEHLLIAQDSLIMVYNLKTFKEQTFAHLGDRPVNVVTLKYFKDCEKLWVGTLNQGLFLLYKEGDEIVSKHIDVIPSQPIRAIEPISEKSLFIGVDGQGLWVLDRKDLSVSGVYKEEIDNPGSLKGNGVYDIYCDNNNRIWVCTYSGGASFLERSNPMITQYRHILNQENSLVNNDVNDVVEDEFGKLWFATNNGISIYDKKSQKWSTLYSDTNNPKVFQSLCEDDKGRMWAGTYSAGFYLINVKSQKTLRHFTNKNTKGKINSDFVFDIIKEKNGDMWVGGVDGDLINYNSTQGKFNSFGSFTVKKLFDFSQDTLLICSTYGLLQLDKKTRKSEILLNNSMIYDIYKRGDILWLCTGGKGVIRFNYKTREQSSITVDDGLPSNFITSISYKDGEFWVGTEHGMCRIIEKNSSIITFNDILTLTNTSFNPHAHDLMQDGSLLWGTNKGVIKFDPYDIRTIIGKGRIFFQELMISGSSIRDLDNPSLTKPLDELDALSLKYFQNTLSLELLPIGLSVPGAKFSWKLEGLEDHWSPVSKNRILSYSNIPSGNYTLKVKMYDTYDLLAEREIAIDVVPPVWQTLGFKVLLVLFLSAMLYLVFLFYITRLNRIHSDDKIRFFANTAHDMRTSLTLITGPIEELNKETNLSEKGMQYLHLATEQAHRLWKVVTQLMDFQKSDMKKTQISLSVGDLVKIIENRIMMFESYAGNKDIDLVFKCNVSTFVTAIDKELIEKVVDNLISNAIKYSYSGTKVHVFLDCDIDRWIFRVQDKGIGISKKAQRQLFREYYRAENAVNSKIVGSGIGLLLVKNYVNLHEGKITCQSQANAGSTFTVTIPVSNIDISSIKEVEAPKIENPRPVFIQKVLSPSALSDDPVCNQKMKIMIVEDNEYLRDFLRSALEIQFQVTLADDGAVAWDLLQKQTTDLIVSDIMMPNMDGFELCKKVKSSYDTSHIPIILLTALSGKATELQALGLGADDYLTKPFDVSILQQRIKSVITNREILREKALAAVPEEEKPLSGNELNDKFLQDMLFVVKENMDNTQFSKSDFATSMNVCPSLLYKKIKSLTNQSPTDFIKAVRLEHALKLLKSKRYTITEISEMCGFGSVGYFSTVFRKRYGKSPTQMMD